MLSKLIRPLMAVLVVVACSSAPTETSPTPNPPESSTPSSTQTIPPIATSTLAPTSTPISPPTSQASSTPRVTPAPTPTPTPTVTSPPATATPTLAPATPIATPAASATASSGGTQLVIGTASDGQPYLVDPAGFTLYVYDNDPGGASNCNGECAQAWPPLTVEPGTTIVADGFADHFSTFSRVDESTQLAYSNRALYRYAGDTRPGQTNGEGIAGFWHIARPSSS